jgi:hypothetical protein
VAAILRPNKTLLSVLLKTRIRQHRAIVSVSLSRLLPDCAVLP